MIETTRQVALPRRKISWEGWWWVGAVAALIFWSFSIGGGEFLAVFTPDGIGQISQYTSRFWPPAVDEKFLRLVGWATLETLAISIAGTAISVVIAGITLYFASSDQLLGAAGDWESTTPHHTIRNRIIFIFTRGTLNMFRTIPELVWAIFFVFAAGLGPFAGTLALGLHNGGVLGKLYAETLENVQRRPVEALRSAGASRFAAFIYGAMPQAWPQLIAYSLYRWEVNIRVAAILGFVGAGGLGQQMHIAISLFLESRLATLTFATFALVNVVDLFSGYLRRKLEAAF